MSWGPFSILLLDTWMIRREGKKRKEKNNGAIGYTYSRRHVNLNLTLIYK